MKFHLFGFLFSIIDKNIKKYGIQGYINHVFIKNKVKVKKYGMDRKLVSIVKNESVVVIGNHPTLSEPLVVFKTLPIRKKLFIVINSLFTRLGHEATKKHFIPVFPKGSRHKPVLLQTVLGKLLFHREKISREEAHKINVDNISEASKRLNSGSLIVIFPFNQDFEWSDGLAYMLKNSSAQKIYLVMTHMRNTSNYDMFRFVPIVRNFFKPIEMRYSEAICVSELRKAHPKEITAQIKDKYKKWSEKLKFDNS